jgi:phosphinothricin acetyltransferase
MHGCYEHQNFAAKCDASVVQYPRKFGRHVSGRQTVDAVFVEPGQDGGGMEFEIMRMDKGDGPEVLAVYEESIAARQATFETSLPSWEQWKASHLTECCFVAKAKGVLLGWAALRSTSSRRCYSGVAEASVYVCEKARGQGIGTALLEKIIAESEARGFWTIEGVTFPENTASLRLQAHCGFREVGRRERIAKLDGVWRDTVLTERRSRRAGTT